MAIPKFLEDLNIIAKLGDNPGTDNGLSTSAFRAKFDEAGLKIQQFLNDVIVPAMEASSNPEGGLNMQGQINMNGQKLRGVAAPTADDEAVNWGSVKNHGKLQFTNTVVAPTAFVDDTTYEAYPYRAKIQLSGVTSTMIPEVIFGVADAMSGMFAPAAESYNGGIYIYATGQPEANITIPTILLWKGESA